MAECLNQGALVECYFGRFIVVEALCLAQLQWVCGLNKDARDVDSLKFSFQPWINLARLERLLGRTDDALLRLSPLVALPQGRRASFGPVEIDAADWRAMEHASPDFRQFFDTVYVIEHLKTLLGGGRFEMVLALQDRLHDTASPVGVAFLREAEIVALCHLGERARAWSRSAAHLERVDLALQPIFQLRHAQALSCFGDLGGATEQLSALSALIQHFNVAKRPNLAKLSLAWQVARLSKNLGDHGTMVELAEAGYRGSCLYQDEVLQAEFLWLLMTDPRKEEAQRWHEAWRDLQRSTWYAMLRGAERLDGEDSTVIFARTAAMDYLTNQLLALAEKSATLE